MTDHELQLKAVALGRAGILTAKSAKGFWSALFAYFAWFAVEKFLQKADEHLAI
jgi:hypothetical protein